MRHGLVIGKFLPPHAGHLALIRRAASASDSLSVVVMASQFERLGGFDGVARARWLQTAVDDAGLRNVRVLSIPTDAVEDMASDAVWAAQVELMRRCLANAGEPTPTHVFGSEPYLARLATELGAEPVVEQIGRAHV